MLARGYIRYFSSFCAFPILCGIKCMGHHQDIFSWWSHIKWENMAKDFYVILLWKHFTEATLWKFL